MAKAAYKRKYLIGSFINISEGECMKIMAGSLGSGTVLE